MKTLVIKYDRYRTGKPFDLDIVCDDRSGLGLPSQRDSWRVLALTEQEAHKTVAYHFFSSMLWYRLVPADDPR